MPKSLTTRSRIFPWLIGRISGLPVTTVDAFRDENFVETCTEVLRLYRQCWEDREASSSLLYDVVGSESDDDLRHDLIQLRRDLYNLRDVDTSDARALISQTTPQTEAATRDRLFDILDRLDRYHRLRSTLRDSYADLLRNHRERLVELIQHEDVQRGIGLSSPGLYQQQEEYFDGVQTSPGNLSSSQRRIEETLLRYLTRTAAKATPFAAFCGICAGRIVEDEAANRPASPSIATLKGAPQHKTVTTRLNKSIYGIVRRYVKETPSLRRQMRIEPNPTLSLEDEERYAFVDVTPEGDQIRRVPAAPLLQLICDVLDSEGHTMNSLHDWLVDTPRIDATDEEIWHYIEQLVEQGFLNLTMQIPTQDLQWSRKLIDFLSSVDATAAEPARTMVRSLRSRCETLSSTSPDTFVEQLEKMNEEIHQFLRGTDLDVTVETPAFEDAAADAEVSIQKSQEWDELSRSLREYVARLNQLSYLRCDQANMRHFYNTYYDSSGSVGLVSFFEAYYREHYKEQREKEIRGDHLEPDSMYRIANPFDLPFVDRIREANRAFCHTISERWGTTPDAEELSLTRGDLDAILDEVPPLEESEEQSLTALGELADSPDADSPLRFHLQDGGFRAGFGTFFSRFLYLLPQEVEEAVRDSNAHDFNHVFAELGDDANFNANLHPPLTTSGIRYPPELTTRSDLRQIGLRDLSVQPHPDADHVLLLQHEETGERVFPLDTGFLDLRRRPPLYKLLTSFSPSSAWYPDLPRYPATDASEASADSPDVWSRPRLVFDDRVVLSRKTWFAHGGALPRRQSEESAFDYFLRVNRWREKHGIPDRAYVRVKLEDGPSDPQAAGNDDRSPGKNAERKERLLGKPQYVDFQSPLLTHLLSTSLPPHENYTILFEECWPSRDAMLTDEDGTPFATELEVRVDVLSSNAFSASAG